MWRNLINIGYQTYWHNICNTRTRTKLIIMTRLPFPLTQMAILLLYLPVNNIVHFLS